MAEFLLDFPVVFTVSIIMIRLRYIVESFLSFQTVLFSGLRNIASVYQTMKACNGQNYRPKASYEYSAIMLSV